MLNLNVILYIMKRTNAVPLHEDYELFYPSKTHME